MTEDQERDIQSLLGRSEHKSVEAVSLQNERVRQGLEQIQYSSLLGNVLDQLITRIKRKWNKRYGSNTALVVRDASPIPWGWDSIIPQIRERLDLTSNPFVQGIWIIDYDKTKLVEIVCGNGFPNPANCKTVDEF
jgi:hypothetical protein